MLMQNHFIILYNSFDYSIFCFMKEADKGSAVVVWDREDHLREANNQLSDKDVYREVKGDAEGPLMKVIKSVLGKIRNRCDISDESLDYFLVNNSKLGRFYLFPKIYKRLHNVPGRPVISSSSYFTDDISSFLDFYLKPLAQIEILYSRYEWFCEKDSRSSFFAR